MSTETICLLEQGRGLDFDRYVRRTFTTRENAWKFENKQRQHVNIVVLPGRRKVGDRIDWKVEGKGLLEVSQ